MSIKKRLLTKKDFLIIAKNMYPMLKNKGHYITDKLVKQNMDDFKKMKVSEFKELPMEYLSLGDMMDFNREYSHYKEWTDKTPIKNIL